MTLSQAMSILHADEETAILRAECVLRDLGYQGPNSLKNACVTILRKMGRV